MVTPAPSIAAWLFGWMMTRPFVGGIFSLLVGLVFALHIPQVRSANNVDSYRVENEDTAYFEEFIGRHINVIVIAAVLLLAGIAAPS